MKEYKYNKVALDEYTLEYRNINGIDVKRPLKRSIEMAQKIQGIPVKSRIKMYKEMTKNNITKEDLIIKTTKEDGTIVYDETNYREFEQKFMGETVIEVIGDLIKSSFNVELVELMRDMGVDITKVDENKKVEQNVVKFLTDFMNIINGKEEEKKEEIPSSEELL